MVAAALNVGGAGGGAAASGPTRISTPRSPARRTRPAPSCPLRRGPQQLSHDRRTIQAVRRDHRQRWLSGNTQQGEVHQRALWKGDVLIIANALGAEGMGQARRRIPVHRGRVRRRPRLGPGRRLAAADHRPRPVRLGRRVPGQAIRGGHEQGHTSDPANSEGGETSLVFTHKNHLLGDHPITKGRDDPSGSIGSRPSPVNRSRGRPGASPPQARRHSVRRGRRWQAEPGRRSGTGPRVRLWQGPGRRHGRGGRAVGQLIGTERFG